jgi:hypothetical protein
VESRLTATGAKRTRTEVRFRSKPDIDQQSLRLPLRQEIEATKAVKTVKRLEARVDVATPSTRLWKAKKQKALQPTPKAGKP